MVFGFLLNFIALFMDPFEADRFSSSNFSIVWQCSSGFYKETFKVFCICESMENLTNILIEEN